MKRKYRKVNVFLLGLAVCLSGCSGNASREEKNTDSIASGGISGVTVSEGCEIVENKEDFYQVKEEQAYNESTDCNNGVLDSVSMDCNENYVYCLQNGVVYCMDKNSGNFIALCDKPDCAHNTADCNAYVAGGHGIDIDVYENYIYSIVQNKDEEKITLDLIKMSKDGSGEREIAVNLASMKLEDNNSVAVRWIIHRGYIYYVYILNSGYTEDTYYLNGSNCIYRRALDGSGEAECIMPLDLYMDKNYVKLKAVGSYVYFIMPEIDDAGLKGKLYRYNTESDKIEYISQAGYIADYAAVGETLIFKKAGNPYEIWRYDSSDNSAARLFEADKNIGQAYYDVCADDHYIYNLYDNGDGSAVVYVACDYEGNYIGQFEKPQEYEYMGMDEKNIYFQTNTDNDVKFCYITKEEALSGAAEMIFLQ